MLDDNLTSPKDHKDAKLHSQSVEHVPKLTKQPTDDLFKFDALTPPKHVDAKQLPLGGINAHHASSAHQSHASSQPQKNHAGEINLLGSPVDPQKQKLSGVTGHAFNFAAPQ